MSKSRFLGLLLVLLPTVALATDVKGVLAGDTTWTPAGNPWVITDDFTIPEGVTLTLEPGVSVVVNRYNSEAYHLEFQVRGALVASGTKAAPISITKSNSYPIEVHGSLVFDHVTMTGGFEGIDVQTTGTATFNHSTIQQCFYALNVAGTATFENGVIQDCNAALWANQGRSILRYSLIQRNGTGDVVRAAVQINSKAEVTLSHNTFINNLGGAIDASLSVLTTVALDIHDNIIVSNGPFGLDLTRIRSPLAHHNLVWGHTEANYVGVAPGTGDVTANPLFVGTTDLSLTERSPARKAGSDGSDLGAFPYEGAPTPAPLQGVLFSDMTLTGAHVLGGDLTVSPGVTLTLAPGASLSFAASDGLAGGVDPQRVELHVNGALRVQGTQDSPATIDVGTGLWVGIRGTASFEQAQVKGTLVLEGAGTATFRQVALTGSQWIRGTSVATFQHVTLAQGTQFLRDTSTATFEHATVTGGGPILSDSANATFTDSIIQDAGECVKVNGGTFSFERGTIQGCVQAIVARGGDVNLSYSVVRANGVANSDLTFALDLVGVSTSLVHNTIIDNRSGGINVATRDGGTAEIRDNIVASNNSFGVIVVPTPDVSIHHNDVWGHRWDYTADVVPGPGSISADPLFVSPQHFTVLETSPCRNAASDGTDMGAFPYVPVVPASIVVTPSPITLAGKGTLQLSAKVYDAAGLELPRESVTWSASQAAGSIDASGKFTAGCSLGTHAGAVVATTKGVSSAVDVTLTLGSIQSVAVTPAQLTLRINESRQLSASALDACGNDIPATFQWGTRDPAGTISTSGLFTAGTRPGTYPQGVGVGTHNTFGYVRVTVEPGEVQRIEVTPNVATVSVQSTQQFTAVGRDSANNIVPGAVTWSVVAGGGTISSTGLFTAGTRTDGYVDTVRASMGNVSRAATVFVTPGPVRRVEVHPTTFITLPTRGSAAFGTLAFDEWGNRVEKDPTWTVTPASAGTIDANGVFTAGVVAGKYPGAVTASVDGVRGFVDVTITPGPLARISLRPTSTTLSPEGTQHFSATALDADGNVLAITPTWTVLKGAGSITSDGLYTAPKVAGTYVDSVIATAQGVMAKATVTVVPGVVIRVVVSPENPSVGVKGTVAFKVEAFDAYDNAVSTSSATWKVLTGVGTIDASGVFTAGTVAGTYPETVQVIVGGMTRTTGVTVTPGALSRIDLAPGSPTVPVGGTVMFSAKTFDAYGNEVPSPAATWRVVNGGGLIDASGVFTAGTTLGTFTDTIQVTMGDVTERTSVAVVKGAASRIVFSPQNPTVPAGGTVAFSIQVFDAYGNEVSAHPATWKVVNGGGTVDGSGLFTAGSSAGTFVNTVQVTVEGATATTSVTITSTQPEPECRQSSDCGSGETCNSGVCEAPSVSGGNEGGGGGCSSSGTGTSVFGLLVLVMLAVDSRKRRAAR
ncbi:right-handed parallel beta-helix repeat-containing protein [Myxococcus stipitatus]|uniref:right-handed parallel beta-helix repeat-containing protein n=1 Tax=Myxococcus stipitatus TaxID=83455 RepID=UPI001F1B2339|nr:right-handed parallel beta-helix repeat-containing protein [Myxococcus stipitatus]MCE9668468.1 right-handed parallel beta-helix repeat-containing protein [Myxococcus stipitatus]